MVTYANPGVYDVSLTVSNGVEENTLLMEDFIDVSDIQASFEADNVEICDNDMVQFSSSIGCTENLMWSFEGGEPATSDEANPTVTYTAAGVYSVSLTAYNGDNELEVVEESYITVHNCSGIGSINLNKMRVAPNPGNGFFKVSLPDNGVYQVQVFDMTGHEVYTTQLSSEVNQLDISHLNNGVYFLNANNGTTQLREKVVIE
jgi:PKD repeat protein